jgi:uncharacterized LabA/DUF88 family protein
VPPEPATKRTIAFVDGQNLFHMAKHAFGYLYPNYDPLALAQAVVGTRPDWALVGTRFYTGVPDSQDSNLWNHFWSAKLAVLGTRDVFCFSRPIRHGKEKGIDVRIALDVVQLARLREYDVALIFSQDQDLSEAADEVRAISIEQTRWIKVACAFPSSAQALNTRGINGTEWIPVAKQLYDQCLDPLDYRPKKA